MERAARSREIVHLYWHPHNFGVHLDENMSFLRAILETFARFSESHRCGRCPSAASPSSLWPVLRITSRIDTALPLP